MNNNKHEEVLQAIQNFITARERTVQKREDLAFKTLGELDKTQRRWTLTQLHILSLINKNNNLMNNASLAAKLNISKPAVTKAINILKNHDLILTTKKSNNNKELYYTLTDDGQKLANVHDQLHEKVKEQYIELFQAFSEEELDVVIRFLNAWSQRL